MVYTAFIIEVKQSKTISRTPSIEKIVTIANNYIAVDTT
jgi:hypothetical protein